MCLRIAIFLLHARGTAVLERGPWAAVFSKPLYYTRHRFGTLKLLEHAAYAGCPGRQTRANGKSTEEWIEKRFSLRLRAGSP